MRPEVPPTAEGDLQRTPLSHLLVYAVDRRLTGALFLTEPAGTTHVIRFARGVAVKVRPGDDFARLGELLVQEGVLTEDLLTGALAAKGLLGDVLVLAGRLDAERLDQILERQFMVRMTHLFALGPETLYSYYDGHCELVDWGGEPVSIEPLAVIWAGLKEHAHVSAKFEETLARLGDVPLAIHAGATLDGFGFDEVERAAVDVLIEKPVPLSELVTWDLVPLETLRRLIYALVITRQIDLGTGTLPVGAEGVMRQPAAAPASLGRVALRPAKHRLGAAAPDPAGDGERAPIAAPSRRRRRASQVDLTTQSTASDSSPTLSTSSESGEPRGDGPSTISTETSSEPVASTERELAPAPDSGAAPRTAPLGSVGAAVASPSEPAQSAGDLPPASSVTPSADVRVDTGIPHDTIAEGDADSDVSITLTELDAAASGAALFELALTHLAERSLQPALDTCLLALQSEPRHPDYLALHVWIRGSLPGADVKALSVELDDLIQRHDVHVPARYYRGMLRRRLGDEPGAIRDLARVVELAPNHSDAARELKALQGRQGQHDTGLIARIFKR